MSKDNEEKKEDLGEVKEGAAPEKPSEEKKETRSNEDILKDMLIAERTEKEKWMNKYYGELADVQNLRKQIQRDNEETLKYRALPFITKLVSFLNSMDMAFKSEPKDPSVKSWMDGVHMSYRQLWSTLTEEGLVEIDPKPGDEFDPHTMESMDSVEGDEPDKVANVLMKGYKLKDRLVSPAMVIVTRAKEKKEEEKSSD